MKSGTVITLAAMTASLIAAIPPLSAQSEEQSMRPPQEIFETRCAHCHASGGWGTRVLAKRVPVGEAELTRRTNLPASYTRMVVRRGIGAMPQFTPTELTDQELEALAIWLQDGG